MLQFMWGFPLFESIKHSTLYFFTVNKAGRLVRDRHKREVYDDHLPFERKNQNSVK